jgi:hypothetical protein
VYFRERPGIHLALPTGRECGVTVARGGRRSSGTMLGVRKMTPGPRLSLAVAEALREIRDDPHDADGPIGPAVGSRDPGAPGNRATQGWTSTAIITDTSSRAATDCESPKHDIQERLMDVQTVLAVVNEARRPELVHEGVDA